VVVARLPVPALACKTGSEGIRAPFRQLQVVVRGVATDTAFGTGSNLVVALARLAVIGIGGALVVQGQLTIGTLIAFRGDVGGLFGPVQGLSGTYQSLQKARVSLEQIFGILDMQEHLGDRPGAIDLPLMCFYDPESGRVLFDGDDLRDLKQKSIRRHVGVVLQAPLLFNEPCVPISRTHIPVPASRRWRRRHERRTPTTF
jgi:ATP-binding cassette subfamily B protein